ncbi:DegT/DnrJ/EryC1/StrS family aminotransferase [Vibrio owensii]|uniref:DegT/DnrJ/EryC1/StrS family aminotransferase n=1 Tax=Vibrio owensii TaxID=696485 RepID=UPI003CE4D697
MIPLVKVGMPPKEVLMPVLEDALYSGKPINEGEAVYQFEKKFISKYQLPKTSMAMSSGTAALHAALTLSGVQEGDEVITTSLTAEPTNLAIKYVGAKPVFCDVEKKTGNISVDSILNSINEKTKAILVVHYAGYPVDILNIREICNKNGIKLIEDCAHALGSTVNNIPVGNFGDYAIFSFQAIKHFTTVDGGFLVCNSESDYIKGKKFRWFGMSKEEDRTKLNVKEIGYKYNYQNVFASIGIVQLDYIDERVNSHIENGNYYNKQFEKHGLDIFAKVDSNTQPSYWLYTLILENKEQASCLENYLINRGICASKLHKLNHKHSIFKNERSLDETCDFYDRMLHIPCGWWLSKADRNKIVNSVIEGVESASIV